MPGEFGSARNQSIRMDRKAFILENTELVAPYLCPEIRLHLITERCPLWNATEKDLATLAIGDPYWGFCWAGGQALARHILDCPELVAGKRIFDFGAGCGIEAVAAMKSGASRVLASDLDPMAAEASRLNALANGIRIESTTVDFFGASLHGFDTLLAGDMFYDPAFARRALDWFAALAAGGVAILFADPGRGNLAGGSLRILASYMAAADVDISGSYLQQTTVYTLSGR